MANYGNNKPVGERIMDAIPGTEQHRATHGVTGEQRCSVQVQSAWREEAACMQMHPLQLSTDE
jgi:hypothetical protein